MPLSVNVGLSRKAGRDYQSTGYSINVTAELDSALLAKPEQLQQQIADLYAQAEAALDRQAGESAAPATPSRVNGDRFRVNASTAAMDASATVIAKKTCLNNLRLIDDAKQQWATDFGKPDSAVPSEKDLAPYLKNKILPVCPGGGIYLINAVDEFPTCSTPGHVLPE